MRQCLIWLAEHELLTHRSVEPQDMGIEGAVLTQKAFVVLAGVPPRSPVADGASRLWEMKSKLSPA